MQGEFGFVPPCVFTRRMYVVSDSLSPPLLPGSVATVLSRSQSMEPVGLGTEASLTAHTVLASLACQVGTSFVGSDSGGEGLK